MKAAVTFTGGVDSTVLAYWIADTVVAEEIHLLFCDYGQANADVSKKLLFHHVPRIKDKVIYGEVLPVHIPRWHERGYHDGLWRENYVPPKKPGEVFDYGNEERSYADTLVDGRNAFLFLTMLSYCSHNDIPVLHAGHQYESDEWDHIDSYRHRTEDFGPYFVDRMNLLQEVGFQNPVRIRAPFLDGREDKREICLLGSKLGVDLTKTYSCQYYPECGRCDNCVCRERTFRELGIDNRTFGTSHNS